MREAQPLESSIRAQPGDGGHPGMLMKKINAR
jgi:hypothetical protein